MDPDTSKTLPNTPSGDEPPTLTSVSPVEDAPTDSHALAQADHDEKGAAQLDHDEIEVKDLGWNDEGKDVPKYVYHLDAITS